MIDVNILLYSDFNFLSLHNFSLADVLSLPSFLLKT